MANPDKITLTESQHFAQLNYHNSMPLLKFLDVATYLPDERFFMTSDGRFCMAWLLSGVPDETLSNEQKLNFSNAFTYVLNQFPESSCGQIIRYKHSDIAHILDRFGDNYSDAPYAKELVDSIIDRQVAGASIGFFSDISDDMRDQALANAIDSAEDDDEKEALYHKIENSSRDGSFAHISNLYLTFSFEPRWVRKGFVVDNFLDRLRGSEAAYAAAWKKEVDFFKTKAEAIQNALAKYQFFPEMVTGQGLVEMLYRELNPARFFRAHAPKFTPKRSIREIVTTIEHKPVNEIGNAFTFTPIETGKTGIKIDDTHYCTVSLRDLPSATRAGMLNEVLDKVDGENWTTINFHVTPQKKVRLRLALRKSHLATQSSVTIPLFAPDPVMLEKKRADISEVDNATNPEERNTHLVVNAAVHLALKGKNLEAVSKQASSLEEHLFGYGYREVDRGDAIAHTMLPFNYRPSADKLLLRSNPTLTPYLGDLCPIFAPYRGVDSDNVLLNNTKGEPIFISLFGNHVVAGHSLVVGGTGSGKSFWVNNLLMQMYAKNRTKIFMIDKGASYRALCESVNGSYIALALEKDNEGAAPVCINPFYVPSTMEGEARKPEMSEIFFMHRVILSMIMNGSGGTTGIDVGMTKEDTSLLLRCLREMFDENIEHTELTLSDYVTRLRTYSGENERGPSLASKLYEFTKEGIYGALFDGKLGVNWDADMIVIETDKLDGTPVMGVIMMTLFYQIDLYCKYKLPRHRQKVIGIDEAWAALSDPTGEIPRMVSGFYREMRKYLCAVMLISQDIATFVSLIASEGASSGILGNTRHFFMLSASTKDLVYAKEHLGFTSNEVECWKKTSSLPPFYSEIFYRMITKSDHSYSGRFRLMSNPVALWIATTQPNDVEMKRKTIGKYLEQTNGNRMEATRLALVELSKEYPYGSQYKKAG